MKYSDNDIQKINDAFGSEKMDPTPVASLVRDIITELDSGTIRVVDFNNGQPNTNQWIKKAILLYFRLQTNELIPAGAGNYYDKVPLKTWTGREQVRVVPPAIVRRGAFVEPGVILMPSYVNIGAYVGSGSMIDTWATVGSCAVVGKNVHISGGVGLGGVLEPVQASPVIIEDDAFVGSRAIIVEGVRVGKGAVIAAGVSLTSSTKIIDVSNSTARTYQGEVPPNSVVIPGSIPKKFAAGEYGVSCALIIGQRKESTNKKTSLNEALRNFDVAF